MPVEPSCVRWSTPAARGSLVVAALLIAAGVAVACWGWWREAIAVWQTDPNYSHGWLVPPLSAWFTWRAWRRVGPPIRRHVSSRETILGTLEVILGLALAVAGWFVGVLLVSVVALICVLRGLLLALGGREVNHAYGFAAVVLIFMAPLPMAIQQALAVHLQDIVATLSTLVFRATDVPVFREGHLIHLPGYTMQIGAACSGLRQVMGFVALGFVASQLVELRPWGKAVLIAATVPVAVAANCLRVVLTGWILMLAGPRWADGVFHTLEGLATVGVGTALMAALAWLLVTLDRRRGRTLTTPGTSLERIVTAADDRRGSMT